jgi:hypothetical protein
VHPAALHHSADALSNAYAQPDPARCSDMHGLVDDQSALQLTLLIDCSAMQVRYDWRPMAHVRHFKPAAVRLAH